MVTLAEKVETRVCHTCGVEKPITAFSLTNYKGKQYRLHDCIPCRWARNKDQANALRRAKYQENPDEIKARNEKYRQEHWPEIYSRHRESRKQRMHDYYNRLKETALRLYGGKCECCGESQQNTLTLDHINGGGRKSGIIGMKLLHDVLTKYEELGYPNGIYRLLCWNCNTSLGSRGYCPHTGASRGVCSRRSDSHWKLKLEIIRVYGGKCELCGETTPEFLTIDHVHGGGSKHHKQLSINIYSWLKKQGWPKLDCRLLCMNCNCGRTRNHWSPAEVET